MPHRAFASPFYRAAIVTALFTSMHAAMAADLTVTIENVLSGDGEVRVGVFDSPDSFPKKARVGKIIPAAQRDAAGRITLHFTDLPEGSYAVSAFHDKDGNAQLNKNLLGIPNEPYGFSGRGGASFGPPSFNDTSFDLPSSGAALTISIK
jgi:uncharacterized protein (DUF2141 family)